MPSGRTIANRPQPTHTINGVTVGISPKTFALRGTGLGLTGATTARVVSGKTIASRPVVTPTGARVVSGKTIASRPVVNTTPPIVTGNGSVGSTGDAMANDPGVASTGAKSGATMFQRNLTNLELKIFETVIIAALLIGGIFVVKKYKLLQGGR